MPECIQHFFRISLRSILMILSMAVAFAANGRAFAGDRPDINTFSALDQTTLYNAMATYITLPIIEEHLCAPCDKHGSSRFLVWHRNYIKGMEDYLIAQGLPQFVPLPKWDPSTCAPGPFATGIVAACAGAISCGTCSGVGNCNAIGNPCPGISLPASLSTNLCTTTWAGGFRSTLEHSYHDCVHIAMGGVMGNFRSPAAPIFWLWHAFVDDIWFDWQCACGMVEGATEGSAFTTYTAAERITNIRAGVADAWMRDSAGDVANEPNNETGAAGEVLYLSPDIWVRNLQDSPSGTSTTRFLNEHQHQNPEYGTVMFPYIYVKVRNRGCTTATGNVHVYWANASTGLMWQTDFTEVPPLAGLPLTITAGREVVAEFQWTNIPQPTVLTGDHFCLVARFVPSGSTVDPINGELTGVNVSGNVYNSNQIAWKNVTIVDNDIFNFTVLVRNISRNGNFVRLGFGVPKEQLEDSVFQHGTVAIDLGPELFARWIQNGGRGDGIKIDPRGVVRILRPFATMDGLPIGFREQFLVTMQFGPGNPPCADNTTVFGLNLLAFEGQTFMGGNFYEIHPPAVRPSPPVVIEAAEPPINCSNGAVHLRVVSMLPTGTTLQWLRDELFIPGASGPGFTATQTGHYSVLASYPNGCDRMSAELPVFIDLPPRNDSPCSAVAVALGRPVGFDIRCATRQPGEPAPRPGSSGDGCMTQDGWCRLDPAVQNSVWYRFTAPLSGPVTIHAGELEHGVGHEGNLVDTQLAVWVNSGCENFASYQLLAANDNSGHLGVFGADPEVHALDVTAGVDYYIQIDGFNGARGDGMLLIESTIEACSCDWNGDSILNSQDFFDFLSSLFAGDADFNNDGTTNSQDFFDFLNCMFAGCP